MRILVAPDSFKGTLSAGRAADAIADGLRAFDPSLDMTLLPLADGGEGTVRTLGGAGGYGFRSTVVTGPRWSPVAAEWALHPSRSDAVVESASCLGLPLLPLRDRDPLFATSYGLGELLHAASLSDPGDITVGLGGTATNDCGLGLAVALGFTPRLTDGSTVTTNLLRRVPLSRLLRDVSSIGLPEHPLRCTVTALADVMHPLTGPRGATRTFGPQKGLSEAAAADLDEAVEEFAAVIRRDVRDVPPQTAGAGAAGGLGFALAAFTEARLERGIDAVLRRIRFLDRCAGVDLVVTGEGCCDAQTVDGRKAVAGVVDAARAAGVPCVVLAGRIAGEPADLLARLGADALFAALPAGSPDPASPGEAHALLAVAAAVHGPVLKSIISEARKN